MTALTVNTSTSGVRSRHVAKWLYSTSSNPVLCITNGDEQVAVIYDNTGLLWDGAAEGAYAISSQSQIQFGMDSGGETWELDIDALEGVFELPEAADIHAAFGPATTIIEVAEPEDDIQVRERDYISLINKHFMQNKFSDAKEDAVLGVMADDFSVGQWVRTEEGLESAHIWRDFHAELATLQDFIDVMEESRALETSRGDFPIGGSIAFPGYDLGMPIPYGYMLLNGSAVWDVKSPMYGKPTQDTTGKIFEGTALESSGILKGSETVNIQKNNLPTDVFDSLTQNLTPSGSVNGSIDISRLGNGSTNYVKSTSDTHFHTIKGDSATDVKGGGLLGGDTVLRNTDGAYVNQVSTESDIHEHWVDIQHEHTATADMEFSGDSVAVKVYTQLNDSKVALSVRQPSVLVPMIMRIF